jgi:uncharacterized protein YbgA (DUF1722 family)/uncharacterized protein YbbK (DUF523 family)
MAPRLPVSSLLRLGISRCLLGEEVRYDGGHQRDGFLTDVLGRYVEWVPVCPEVEVGMGVPREPIRLVGRVDAPRLLGVHSNTDHSAAMARFSERRVRELAELDLCGYVFKKNSPSCGMARVRVFNARGTPSATGVGLFARVFMNHFPLIPVEEEGRLQDPVLRENFIERVFCYRRWRDLEASAITRHALAAFHAQHKLLLMAHDPVRYRRLGRLAAGGHDDTAKRVGARYSREFMAALGVKPTAKKHVNVLEHIRGHFSRQLTLDERRELTDVIEDYRRGFVPLIVPVTLMKHYVRRFQISYLADQVYLNPHPKELRVRNHV